MTDQSRAIVHLDLDAFFASVEALENPELAGQPVLVGGRAEERGVVAAASYPARVFGVRSAMPMRRALQLCPQAIVLPPRHGLYRDYSRRVMAILHEVTPLVEQVSVDEAFLDLTDRVTAWEEAVEIAGALQARVRDEVGLSASLGVTMVGGLALVPEVDLRGRFGRYGAEMAQRARGIDPRPVVVEHERKSVSQEWTFARDLRDGQALRRQLWRLSQGVALHLQRAGLAAGTVGIKLRYGDFETLTRQVTLDVPTDDERAIYRAALMLLHRTWQHGRPVRLLGVSGQNLCPPTGQLALF